MGVGNENHALFWEYETRIGRRWNLDPMDQINMSNYSVFFDNPIAFNDPTGDDPGARARKFAENSGIKDYRIVKGKSGRASLEWGESFMDGVIVKSKHFDENFFDKAEQFADKASRYLSTLDFALEGSASITFGAQIKAGFKTDGIRGNAEVNGLSFEVISFKGGLHTQKANTHDFYWVGKDDTWKMSQKIGAEIGPAVGEYSDYRLGASYENNWTTYTGGYGVRSGENPNNGPHVGLYQKTEAISGATAQEIENSVKFASKQIMSKMSGSKTGVKDNFVGVDLGGSAAVLFGINLSIKIGFYNK